MDHNEILALLKTVSEKACESHGAFLTDLKINFKATPITVDIFSQTDSGITSETCTQISRDISEAIESNDPFEKAWVLQVSSPGIGNPITEIRALNSQLGRLLKIEMPERDGSGAYTITRYLEKIEPDNILVIRKKIKAGKNKKAEKSDQVETVNFNQIKKLIVEIDW